MPAMVTIAIPAYKSAFFEETLQSALAQTYSDIEILICDDRRDDAIAEVVARLTPGARFPIRYFKNIHQRGELLNTEKTIRFAEGKYIKFLHDDDLLEPDAVTQLVSALESTPGAAMASARRQRIGEHGEPLPDILATCCPFDGDVLVQGDDLVSFLGDYTINFIGEPSSVLCHREHLLELGVELMMLNGKPIDWVGDLALYVKLLKKGGLVFLSRALSRFRVSRSQFSQAGRDQPGIGSQGHANFRAALRELGWVRSQANHRVRVAPLSSPDQWQAFDLVQGLVQVHGRSRSEESVQQWLSARVPTPVQRRLIDGYLAHAKVPRLAVVLAGVAVDPEAAQLTLDSLTLCAAFYPDLEVIIVGDGVGDAREAGLAQRRVALAPEGMAVTLNHLLGEINAPWVTLAAVGEEFTPSGLMMAGLELSRSPECRALYPDEVYRQAGGKLAPVLKPDFNLDMLLSFPAALASHCLFSREALLEIGGFDAAFDGALELNALLRLIEAGGLTGLGHLSEPLVIRDGITAAAEAAEARAIAAHLHARGYANSAVQSAGPGLFAIDYGHEPLGTVSLLLQVGSDLGRLQHCVESILGNTRHPGYELLLVACEAQLSPEVSEWLDGIAAMGEAQLRVLRVPGDHPAVALNQAAAAALGDYLLLLDGECAVLQEDWLQQLLNHAQRPEVGAVGALLLAPDGTVSHAGLLLGLDGTVGRPFFGKSLDHDGYLQRLRVDQNYSAVSGECLMLAREVFQAVGGLDESELGRRWFDVDLCLRLREAGYLNVWTPRARLAQHRLERPAPSPQQQDELFARWLPALARDPAYNPNLSLQAGGDFRLAEIQQAWRPLMAWRPVPVVLAHPADNFGCGHYRVIQPFHALRDAGLVDGELSPELMQAVDLERYDPDVIVLQRQVSEARLEAMRRMKSFSRAFKVYELDDYLPNLPLKSPHRESMPKDIVRSLRRGLGYADRFVVSTEPLAEALSGFHPDIVVAENRLPVHWWGNVSAERRVSPKPRVGWAGGRGHTGDLELVVDVVKALAEEVDWVFMGMCPDVLKPYVKEFVPGVQIELYPQRLAAMNLDLAIAPLEQNMFNECKSSLRLLEYGACGFPVICTDILPYQGALPVTRVRNRYREWVDAIRMHVADLDATARMGDELRRAVLGGCMLDDAALQKWKAAWRV